MDLKERRSWIEEFTLETKAEWKTTFAHFLGTLFLFFFLKFLTPPCLEGRFFYTRPGKETQWSYYWFKKLLWDTVYIANIAYASVKSPRTVKYSDCAIVRTEMFRKMFRPCFKKSPILSKLYFTRWLSSYPVVCGIYSLSRKLHHRLF